MADFHTFTALHCGISNCSTHNARLLLTLTHLDPTLMLRISVVRPRSLLCITQLLGGLEQSVALNLHGIAIGVMPGRCAALQAAPSPPP